MVLEAVMLCIDNSEWSRNGDYLPTRFDSQRETINFLTSSKINGNPESTVGLLSLANERIQVHVSPTRDVGLIMNALAKSIRIGGQARFVAGLKTAALALKNRQNKNQRQRIILLSGSPIADDEHKELLRLAKALKKNSIAVDVINFGTECAANDNADRWGAFIEAINASENSHLVNVPPGPHQLSDMVMASPIALEPGQMPRAPAASASAGASAAAGGDDDIDPNLDPEMAMAIRMSMEEERARIARISGETATASSAAAAPAPAPAAAAADSNEMMDDEEALLQQAIAMSMLEENDTSAATPAPASAPTAPDTAASTTAPASSSASSSSSSSSDTAPSSSTSSTAAPAASADDDLDAAMSDPDFIASLLATAVEVPKAEEKKESKDK